LGVLEKTFKYMAVQTEPRIEIGVEIITAQPATDRARTRFFLRKFDELEYL
jgi:hypothetical protein